MFKFLKRVLPTNNSAIEQALARGAIVVDVRSRDEFREGHISGSKNIPLFEIKQNVPFIRAWNKPVITVCVSGNRSSVAKSLLDAAGIEVYNGGSWQELNNIKI